MKLRGLLLGVVFVMAVLCGCESPRYKSYTSRNESNSSKVKDYYDAKLRAFCDESDARKQRLDAVTSTLKQVATEEKTLVKNLNDNQLIAYQFAVRAFESNDLASKEIASRNLQKVCDSNTCSAIAVLLSRKNTARREMVQIGKELRARAQDAEAKNQQVDLEYNLMMRETMRDINRRR